jgi:hypothetical protein
MEPEGLLQRSQEPAIGSYLWRRESNPHPSQPISLRSILILSSRLRPGPSRASSSVSFLLNFLPKLCMHLYYLLPHACDMPCTSHSPGCHHSNNIWRGAQIMTLLIMQFPPASHYSAPLRSKHSPQHPVLKYPRGRSQTPSV